MTVNYVSGSLSPVSVPNCLGRRIYVRMRLWASSPPLEAVEVTYKFPNSYEGPYQITGGEKRRIRVTGTEASPQQERHWIVISGPEPPPAKLEVYAVIDDGNVRRRGGVALLMDVCEGEG